MYVFASIAAHRAASGGQSLLVLDANAASSRVVVTLLREAGYRTDTCSNAEEALSLLAQGRHRVLVADEHGRDDTLALARDVQGTQPSVSVILLTGDRSLPAAIGALQSGVFDFMTKSFDLSTLAEHLLDAVRRTFEDTGRAPPQSGLVARDPIADALVGQSAGMERAREQVRAAAQSDAPVLILGEAGTEKAAVAQLLHAASPRREQPFELLDAARHDAAALFARALADSEGRGTWFITEASGFDASCQVELVKLLSGLGAPRPGQKPRLIAGLSQPPGAGAASLVPRLFQRLGGHEVALPPLRERGQDVLLLAEHFAEQSRLARGDAQLRISATAIEALARHTWPGNVEELRLAIQHAASLCLDSVIRVVDLPPSIALSLRTRRDESGAVLEVQSLEDVELSYILRVLEAVGGNKASAARLLGVDRTTLYRKLQRQEHPEPLAAGGAALRAPSPSRRRPRSTHLR